MQLSINNKNYKLQWGQGAYEPIEDKYDITPYQVYAKVLEDSYMGRNRVMNELTYSALQCGARLQGTEIDINYTQFLAWLDEQPQEIAVKIVEDWKASFHDGKSVDTHINELIERLNASLPQEEVAEKKVKKPRAPRAAK